MSSDKTKFPTLKWAQRKDRLYITINVVHTAKPLLDIIDGKKLNYSGTDGTNKFAFELELHDEILKEESKYTLDSRNIFLNLKKKTKGPHWPRLTKDNLKYQWIQVDWVYYIDEDEEEDANEPNMEGQNFDDIGDEMDEDDEPAKEEGKKEKENTTEKKEENETEKKEEETEKKADLSDLDKEESK